MGNMFDDMNPPPMDVDLNEGRSSLERRHSNDKKQPKKHKGSTIDDSLDEDDAIDLNYYLSNEERDQLNIFFKRHYSKEDGKFLPDFVSSFHLGGTNFTATKVLHYLNHENIDTPEKFYMFFVECVRIGSTKSFQLLWEVSTGQSASTHKKKSAHIATHHTTSHDTSKITKSSPEQTHADQAPHSDHSHKSIDEKILDFSRFVVDLSCPNISISDSMTAGMKIKEFYTTMLHSLVPRYATHFKVDDFIGIVNSYSPHAFKAFQTYILSNILGGVHHDETSSFKRFQAVQLMGESDVVTPELIALLSLHNDDLQSNWKRLYSSNCDGRSFNRIFYHLLGYEGPTCIVIRCSDAERTILGAYSAEKWRDSNRFYGSSKNFLFTIHPKIRLFRSRAGSNGAYQWLNTKSYGLPHGFGFGGSVEAFRLFITESFENCVARNSCVTYEAGHLLSETHFEVDSIEIWAIGGMDKIKGGLSAQKESREVNQKSIEKARKVDKAAFFNNSFDREFLLSNTFSHQKQTERPDC